MHGALKSRCFADWGAAAAACIAVHRKLEHLRRSEMGIADLSGGPRPSAKFRAAFKLRCTPLSVIAHAGIAVHKLDKLILHENITIFPGAFVSIVRTQI